MFDFILKIAGVIAYKSTYYISNYTGHSYLNSQNYILLTEYLTTDYISCAGFGDSHDASSKNGGKKSNDSR